MNLTIDRVSKTYDNGVKALDELSLEIPTGMFGLLGPNGAGKSSLMRTIATLQPADSGSITFNGIDVFNNPLDLKKNLGYLPQEFGVYENESAQSLLDYFALLKGIISKKSRRTQVERVLELTNLLDTRKKKVSNFSGGMKRRFGIAQILLTNPELIIVDEPTAGLDLTERTRFLNVLRSIGTDHTVIFSTHIVGDVKELCQRLAIVNEGKVILEDSTQGVIQKLNGKIWSACIPPDQLSLFKDKYVVLSTSFQNDQELTIRVFSEDKPEDSRINWLIVSPDLSDVYFHQLENKPEIHV